MELFKNIIDNALESLEAMNNVFMTQELTHHAIFEELHLNLPDLDDDDNSGNVELHSNTNSELDLD